MILELSRIVQSSGTVSPVTSRRGLAARLRHLDNGGRGRRLEIYPVDQSHVDTEYARPLNDRSITVRYIWPDLVQAWAVLLFALRAPRRPSRRGSASSRIRKAECAGTARRADRPPRYCASRKS
ncbi:MULTISPECIES: hypothetical protein [unclassified Streptomyces]|uniref:hypothetical protein n=1 Tax=unclassified Streptomyces TaxID=2593676 RepID=UPI0004BD93A6|nr:MULTISPECIES: hypothetical protein [unclassified Streptomyces]